MASRKHPHLHSPTDEQIVGVLAERSPEVQRAYLAVHNLIRQVLPDVEWSIDTVDGFTGYGVRQYGYGGWGMASLIPAKGWANLAFMQGAKLEDPDGVLEGTGKVMRGIRFRSVDAVEQKAEQVRRVLVAASELNA